MFVIFFSVILILNLSVSRTTGNKNVPFKDKLRRSLTHFNDMLLAIEGKIKQEQKKLLRISNDLNRKLNPTAAKMDTTVIASSGDLMPKDLYNTKDMQTIPATPSAIFTFATMFPSPPADTYWDPNEMIDTSLITDFTVLTDPMEATTTTQSPFIKDMERIMIEDKHNYFTAFLSRFMELIAIKNENDTMPVMNLLLIKLNEKVDPALFDIEEGKRLAALLKMYFPMVSDMPPEKLKEQAMYAHFTLKNKATMMSVEYNNMTDFYGRYFNKADGEELFKALESFYEYNNGKHTAAEVVDMITRATLNPYLRIKETGIDTTASTVSETIESVKHVTESPVHFTQYPEHVTQYPVHVTQNPAYVNQYPEHVTQYPVHVTQYPEHETEYPVHPTEKSIPSWRRNVNFEQNFKYFPLKHLKLLEKMEPQYGNKSKHHHHLSHKQKLDQNYRESRDRQLNEQEQTKQRAYIASEEIYNHPKIFQDTVKNNRLHKIREASSYSDEEDHLRNILYDTLRHGNKTFVTFRKSGGDVINKQTFRDLFSDLDEEWILKNNIYKVFEQKRGIDKSLTI